MRLRVLLADDHAMVAEGLGRILESAADLVGTVNDGGQLVERARQLRPDVIVADVNMPIMSGLDAMRQLRAEGLDARFIFVTIHTEPHLAAEALRAGAAGYVLKQAAGGELIDALHAVAQGRTYLTPLITRDVLWAFAQPVQSSVDTLTPRQREVPRLLARGKRMKEIAFDLNISVRTVERHKYELMHALGLEGTPEPHQVRHEACGHLKKPYVTPLSDLRHIVCVISAADAT